MVTDILLDETGDLRIENGDLVIGDSTQQHQQLLLTAEKGSFRMTPTAGVGLMSFLKDENPEEMIREIRQQFIKDGMNVQRLAYNNGKLEIVAAYK